MSGFPTGKWTDAVAILDNGPSDLDYFWFPRHTGRIS